MATLEIKNLHVEVKDEEKKAYKKILKGVNLTMHTGEIHAIMGPNGTGKSTLSETIMGNPKYRVTEGQILLNGENVLDMAVDERARKGLFLAMQYPAEVPGVTNAEFLRAAINARRPKDDPIPVMDFIKELNKNMALLDMNDSMTERYLNQGFSGGERKKNEILQMLVLNPKIAMLDEIDSGLDVDAINIVSECIKKQFEEKHTGFIVISHYARLFELIKPTRTTVIINGKVAIEGGIDLYKRIDKEGYEWLKVEKNIDFKVLG